MTAIPPIGMTNTRWPWHLPIGKHFDAHISKLTSLKTNIRMRRKKFGEEWDLTMVGRIVRVKRLV